MEAEEKVDDRGAEADSEAAPPPPPPPPPPPLLLLLLLLLLLSQCFSTENSGEDVAGRGVSAFGCQRSLFTLAGVSRRKEMERGRRKDGCKEGIIAKRGWKKRGRT